MSCHHVMTWWWWTQTHNRQISVCSRSYSIATEKVPRDVVRAHVLASPSSAEELRKHLTELSAYRDGEAEV